MIFKGIYKKQSKLAVTCIAGWGELDFTYMAQLAFSSQIFKSGLHFVFYFNTG